MKRALQSRGRKKERVEDEKPQAGKEAIAGKT